MLYVAKDGTVSWSVGRSMDLGEDLRSNMWALSRGMHRDGRGGANSISWSSKYGSVVLTGYDSTNRVVMFDSAMTPATFWVKLDRLDLKLGDPVRRPSRICTNLRINS